nr:peptidase inhibitor family I36 protein [Streptomyces sp. SID3343]
MSGAGLAPTARAQAVASCPVESLCVYGAPDFTGPRTVVAARLVEDRRDAGYPIDAPILSIANRTGFDLLYGASRPAVCIAFPCYQYTGDGRVDSDRDLASTLPTGQTLVVGRDYGR